MTNKIDIDVYKRVLARYEFKDSLGHPLEKCRGFIALLAEIERLQAENERLKVWAGMVLSYCEQELKETSPEYADETGQRRVAKYAIHVLTAALEGS